MRETDKTTQGAADALTLEQAAGQLLVAGFAGVEAPPASVEQALEAGELGGVILFRRNVQPDVEGLRVLAGLNARLSACRSSLGLPPWIAVDQEGGRVVRVRHGVTPLPPMMQVGATGDAALARSVGEVIAAELAELGFNVNFAPVLDVFTNPDNTVIGDRAFGTTPERVADMGLALAEGHLTHRIIPCGKHFPGHGDTLADSHYDLPVLEHDMERLERVELVPFRRAVAAKLPMLMTAHVLIPALDPDHPITLSPHGVGELLRETLGYEGVVVSDDLEMKAVADRYTIEERVELGVRAGVDLFLICHTEALWRRAFEHLVETASRDAAFGARVMASAARVVGLKRRAVADAPFTPSPDLEARVGTAAHRAVLARVAPA